MAQSMEGLAVMESVPVFDIQEDTQAFND